MSIFFTFMATPGVKGEGGCDPMVEVNISAIHIHVAAGDGVEVGECDTLNSPIGDVEGILLV